METILDGGKVHGLPFVFMLHFSGSILNYELRCNIDYNIFVCSRRKYNADNSFNYFK
jgi:hypothetical protein